MPGLRPPHDNHEGDSDFNVNFTFMTLQAQADGKVIPAMTFKQIIDFMAGVVKQLDGTEQADVILKQMIRNLQRYRRRFQ